MNEQFREFLSDLAGVLRKHEAFLSIHYLKQGGFARVNLNAACAPKFHYGLSTDDSVTYDAEDIQKLAEK